MLVSITPLGSIDRDPGRAAIQVVRYVESKIQAARRIEPDRTRDVEAYYADSVEGPGRWAGGGSKRLGLAGEVQTEQLHRVLLGLHPVTGDTLAATGGAPHARDHRRPESTGGFERRAHACRGGDRSRASATATYAASRHAQSAS